MRILAGLADWERYSWVDEATESTVAVLPGTDELPLARLGQVEDQGELDFAAAQALQNRFWGDDTFNRRGIVQAARVGEAWVLVEPNGFRARDPAALAALAPDGRAGSFFWNVNGMMVVLLLDRGEVVAEFDPLFGPVPDDARDLPFEDRPGAAAMALLERHTGVVFEQAWFEGAKPTYVVHAPAISS